WKGYVTYGPEQPNHGQRQWSEVTFAGPSALPGSEVVVSTNSTGGAAIEQGKWHFTGSSIENGDDGTVKRYILVKSGALYSVRCDGGDRLYADGYFVKQGN